MKTYQIEVQERLSRIVKIQAENEEAALAAIKKQYRNEQLVLDSSDYYETTIKTKHNEWVL